MVGGNCGLSRSFTVLPEITSIGGCLILAQKNSLVTERPLSTDHSFLETQNQPFRLSCSSELTATAGNRAWGQTPF